MAEHTGPDFDLSPEAVREVHRQLCLRALEGWVQHIARNGPLDYVDTVIGMAHRVDEALPADAFATAFDRSLPGMVAGIAQRYLEPIAALQDGDLVLPSMVAQGYYAIYNAFAKYAQGRDVSDWLIVNQALAVWPDAQERPGQLGAAIARARKAATP